MTEARRQNTRCAGRLPGGELSVVRCGQGQRVDGGERLLEHFSLGCGGHWESQMLKECTYGVYQRGEPTGYCCRGIGGVAEGR